MLFSRAKEGGLLREVNFGLDVIAITYLQFADDTVIFSKANLDKITSIKRILRCFEILLGLKINFRKSIVSGVGLETDHVKEFAIVFRCKC